MDAFSISPAGDSTVNIFDHADRVYISLVSHREINAPSHSFDLHQLRILVEHLSRSVRRLEKADVVKRG